MLPLTLSPSAGKELITTRLASALLRNQQGQSPRIDGSLRLVVRVSFLVILAVATASAECAVASNLGRLV